MNRMRGFLKLACQVILSVGFAAAAFALILSFMAGRTGHPDMSVTFAFYAAGVVIVAVFLAGVLGFLGNLDERLERLLKQSGGK